VSAEPSLQERFAPEGICFGCGPANAQGLRIRSFEAGTEVVADWTPAPHHAAFEGVLNGGIVGALLDCHCNWTAAMGLMRAAGRERPPATVTAEYSIRLRRPTPVDQPLRLQARVTGLEGNRAEVEGELLSGGVVCATCRASFVAVEPGHPAYHRW